MKTVSWLLGLASVLLLIEPTQSEASERNGWWMTDAPIASCVVHSAFMCGVKQPSLTDAELQAKLIEAGNSLGWGLISSDSDEGWTIWRLKVGSVAHPPIETRFAWHMRRAGEAIEVRAFFVLLDREPAKIFATILERETKG